MVGLAEPPEHVLDPVGRVEQAEEEPLVEPLQLVEHHRLALAQTSSHWSRNASSPNRSLLRPAWSSTIPVVWNVPMPSRQLPGVVRRRADREQRGLGVEVDRRGVELELGLEPDQVEAHRSRRTDWSSPGLNFTRSQSLHRPERDLELLGTPVASGGRHSGRRVGAAA